VNEKTRVLSKWAAVGVTICLAWSAAWPSTVSASSVSSRQRPSRSQLLRLYHLEPYIRYFTSLSYGSEAARVSPNYIRALILSESSGWHGARSGKGARGVTQIIPSTARAVLAELSRQGRDFLYVDEAVFDRFEPDDLYDPALNILIACYLSATYNAKYDGKTDLVVSAWNAGPGAVARYGNRPPPFKETLSMIGRIKGLMDYLGKSDDL